MIKLNDRKLILVVEDSDDDYEYTEEALKGSNLRNPIVRCHDGQQALDYLYRKGEFTEENAPRPGIILLDLNMPGVDGREVLRTVKSDQKLRDIPIVVLTTSGDDVDIEACYKDGANTYIQKPVQLEGFFFAIQQLQQYWFEISILPKGS